MTEEDTPVADPTPNVGPGREYPGTPRWVKVSGIIIIGLILLVIVMLLVGTALGLHNPGGPGGHGMGRDTPPQTLLSSVIKDDAQFDSGFAGPALLSSVTEHGRQQL